MKILLVLLLGIVLTCQGVPVNEVEDDQELEDVIEMNEPEIENEQNEAFGDDMSEYEEDGDNENDESDEEEEDTEDAESDPAKKKPKKKKPKKKSKIGKILKKLRKYRCPLTHRFCRTRTTCNITYKKGKKGAVCKSHRYCVCSGCPKGKSRRCGFKEKKDKKGLTYSLECKCK